MGSKGSLNTPVTLDLIVPNPVHIRADPRLEKCLSEDTAQDRPTAVDLTEHLSRFRVQCSGFRGAEFVIIAAFGDSGGRVDSCRTSSRVKNQLRSLRV